MGVPGGPVCQGGVPGVFQWCSGDVPGCSWPVPGFTDTLKSREARSLRL